MKSKWFIPLFVALTSSLSAHSQTSQVGGPCEGCEAIHESPVPFDKLASFVKLSDAAWEGKNSPNYPVNQ